MASLNFKVEVFSQRIHPFTYLMAKLCTVKGLSEYVYDDETIEKVHCFRHLEFVYDGQYFMTPKIGEFGTVKALMAHLRRSDVGCDIWIDKSSKIEYVVGKLYNYFKHEYAYKETMCDSITIKYADELAGVLRIIYREYLDACKLVKREKIPLTKAHIDNYLVIRSNNMNEDYDVIEAGNDFSIIAEELVGYDEPIKQAFNDGDLDRDNVEFLRNVQRVGIVNAVMNGVRDINERDADTIVERNSDVSVGKISDRGTIFSESILDDDNGKDVVQEDNQCTRREVDNVFKDSEYEGVRVIEDSDTKSEIDTNSDETERIFHVTQFPDIMLKLDSSREVQLMGFNYSLHKTADINEVRTMHGEDAYKYLDRYTYYSRFEDYTKGHLDEFPMYVNERELREMIYKHVLHVDPMTYNHSNLKRTNSEPNIFKSVHFKPLHTLVNEIELSVSDADTMDEIGNLTDKESRSVERKSVTNSEESSYVNEEYNELQNNNEHDTLNWLNKRYTPMNVDIHNNTTVHDLKSNSSIGFNDDEDDIIQ